MVNIFLVKLAGLTLMIMDLWYQILNLISGWIPGFLWKTWRNEEEIQKILGRKFEQKVWRFSIHWWISSHFPRGCSFEITWVRCFISCKRKLLLNIEKRYSCCTYHSIRVFFYVNLWLLLRKKCLYIYITRYKSAFNYLPSERSRKYTILKLSSRRPFSDQLWPFDSEDDIGNTKSALSLDW